MLHPKATPWAFLSADARQNHPQKGLEGISEPPAPPTGVSTQEGRGPYREGLHQGLAWDPRPFLPWDALWPGTGAAAWGALASRAVFFTPGDSELLACGRGSGRRVGAGQWGAAQNGPSICPSLQAFKK